MFSIWFYGFLAVIIGRVFYAGMHMSKFYDTNHYRYDNVTKTELNGERVAGYILFTVGIALTWLVSLPLIGIFKLGERFNKENSSANK